MIFSSKPAELSHSHFLLPHRSFQSEGRNLVVLETVSSSASRVTGPKEISVGNDEMKIYFLNSIFFIAIPMQLLLPAIFLFFFQAIESVNT